MSTMTLNRLNDIERLVIEHGTATHEMMADLLKAVRAHLTPREADGGFLIGYIHPSWLDCGALAMEVSPVRLSDAQVPVYIHPAAQEAAEPVGHDLYKDGDADIPSTICDRNGSVTLGLCKRCGRAEIDLDEPCEPSPEQAVGDGVVAYAIVDTSNMEIEQLCISKDELERWKVEGTEIVPLCFATPRPAVATPAEVSAICTADCDGDPVWSFAANGSIYSIVCVEGGGHQLVHTEGTKVRLISEPFFLAPATPVEVTDCAISAPRVRGVAREPGRGDALTVYFDRTVSDSDMRTFHDALAAQPSAVGVPDGWKLIPVEPTEAMENAMASAYAGSIGGYECNQARTAFLAAIAVAPEVGPRPHRQSGGG